MNLKKQYISQSITLASNNLRLNNQQIEIVALLKTTITRSEDLGNDLINMKKITELSRLAIRLYEIYNYLAQPHIDLLKLSEQFKEHSSCLIKELSQMLENLTPITFQAALEKLNKSESTNDEIKVDLSKRKQDESVFNVKAEVPQRENLILEDTVSDEDIFFQNYEAAILKPIKPLDAMLKRLSEDIVDFEELTSYSIQMKQNGDLSAKTGFDIIANMHWIVARALTHIKTRDLMPGKDIIEKLRACLIVIVAVVKGKEIDISNYLNKAEEFGKQLSTLKLKEYS